MSSEDITQTQEQEGQQQQSNADIVAAKQAAKQAEEAAAAEQASTGQGKSPTEPESQGENTQSDKSGFDAENLASTGNDVLDAGIAMMQKVAGLNSQDVERILSTAFDRGDPSLIDAAYIKERFGEHAGYVEQLAKAYIEHSQVESQRVVKAVHEAAGGEEQWELLNSTFQQSAPDVLKRAVKALADANDFIGASQLVIDYARGTGTVPVQGQHLKGGGSTSQGPLSAADFRKEMTALRESAGNRSFEQGPVKTQYDNLLRRREAGRRQGL